MALCGMRCEALQYSYTGGGGGYLSCVRAPRHVTTLLNFQKKHRTEWPQTWRLSVGFIVCHKTKQNVMCSNLKVGLNVKHNLKREEYF
jgi:hypothetical protein